MQKAAANTVKLHTASAIVHEIAATTRRGQERKEGNGENVAWASNAPPTPSLTHFGF